jgi:hypothetical protein
MFQKFKSVPNFSKEVDIFHRVFKNVLKVSKSQKQVLKFSFEPKNERKYFCNSALVSKMGQIKKIMAHYHAY